MIRELVERLYQKSDSRKMQTSQKQGQKILKNLVRLEETLQEKDRREYFVARVLRLLNEENNGSDKVEKIIACIQDFSGIEAIAIRLREDNDCPYYTHNGFPYEFIFSENWLCGEGGRLECMCGAVLEGRTQATLPFFTLGGSFWTSNASELVKNDSYNLDFATRNRCVEEGYESIALIPLRAGNSIVGLLQLNDKRPGLFTKEVIAFYETLGAMIGVALRRMLTESKLKESEAHYRAMLQALPYLVFRYSKDGTMLEVEGDRGQLHLPPERQIGKRIKEVLPKAVSQKISKAIATCLEMPAGEVVAIDYELPISGGKRQWEARIVRYSGTEDQVLAVVRDVTKERK